MLMQPEDLDEQKKTMLVEKSVVSRRQALKGSVAAIGVCYLAPTTLNLLLAERATAQSDIPPPEPPEPEYPWTLRACNFMDDQGTSTVVVEYIDILGYDSVIIPQNGRQEFPDLLDASEVTIIASRPSYFTTLILEEFESLVSFMQAGDSARANSLLNLAQGATAQDDASTTFSITITEHTHVVIHSTPQEQ